MTKTIPAISDFECEHTPNPKVRKFSVIGGRDRGISPSDATRIARIKGVEDVFFGDGFLSVRSVDDVFTDSLAGSVLDYLDSHAGERVWRTPEPARSYGDCNPTDAKIMRLLDERVRPAVAVDGGDIEFVSFDHGTLTLKMKGACDGCPSAAATLQMGVMGLFSQLLPSVRQVRAA